MVDNWVHISQLVDEVFGKVYKDLGNVFGRKPNYEQLKENLIKLGEEETFDYHEKSKGTRKEQVLKRIWDDAIRTGDMKKIQLLAFLGCLD